MELAAYRRRRGYSRRLARHNLSPPGDCPSHVPDVPSLQRLRPVLESHVILTHHIHPSLFASFNDSVEVGKGMAVRVYISHSGQDLTFQDAAAGLDALKAWIERDVGIPPNRQILMNPLGRNIKTLANDSEVFVFDRRNLSQSSQAPPDLDESLPELPDAPPLPTNDGSLEQVKDILRQNQTWAQDAADAVRNGADRTETLLIEADNISRSIVAALDSVKNYFQAANQKFSDTKQWALDSIQEHNDALSDWERSYTLVSQLPVRDEVASILRQLDDGSRDQHINTLADLFDVEALRGVAQSVSTASREFQNSLNGLQTARDKIEQDTSNVERHVVQIQDSEVGALVDEADTLANRIGKDYEESLKVGNAAPALRKAKGHAQDFIPGLQAVMTDMRQAFLNAQETRNSAARGCFAALREISSTQSRLGSLQTDVANLDFTEQTGLDALFRVFQIPTVYGCTLIEAVRRSEWTNRMQTEVDTLHNDLSQMTEDEQRRRRKWVSSYSDFLNQDLNSQVALIDMKASKPRNAWPFVERDEIKTYIEDLKALEIQDAVDTLHQRLKDLEVSPRKQRLKPFKNGSIQDLAASANGDVRTLQEDKARLEEKIRASESRVRKLEDLLHRQSQTSRPTSDIFTPSEFDRTFSPVPFQRQVELTHRPSISLRRISNAQEERMSAQKISSLEAQVQKLQSEAHEERRSSTESRDKMQEAESIKHDLMANFEAQKQEFEEERQLMDDDNHKLKIRIEELEDELDRILGSREHTKMLHDQKLDDLKTELDHLRETHRGEQETSTSRVEDLERDLSIQRDKATTLERQLQECREERNAARNRNMELANQLRTKEEADSEVIATLQNTHSNLSPAGSAPENLRRLANALEILSEGATIHARGLDDNLQRATAENKSLEEKSAHFEEQVKTLTQKLTSAESKATSLTEMLEHERDKLAAVRQELDGEQTELSNLRSKIAAGESGSEALREKVVEEEKKVKELQEIKYDQESSIKSLKHEMESLRNESSAAVQRLEVLKQKLDARGKKAREMSEKLFQHNDRIIRMLEQFGFSITRQDDSLVIQRASKVSMSTTLSGNESSTPMKRTVSGSVHQQHYSDPSDLDSLYWTSDTETTDEESKYRTFITALQRLDLDSTLDTVSKRYKDVESLAKKYQKDSRAYREKAHRLQSDAHDKIAYRSFKEGDLALFLPTRNQATRPWAAFNVGAPHYFLREQDHHKLASRDWLLARISRVEERIVDLSRSLSSTRNNAGGDATTASSSIRSLDDENPFELSDGLRWYMIDAAEEKPGAPGTPSVGKSTVIASNVEAEALMHRKDSKTGPGLTTRTPNAAQVAKSLNKSLESRRSSNASKRSGSVKKDSSSLKDVVAPLAPIASGAAQNTGVGDQHTEPMVRSTLGDRPSSREDARVFEIVRQDLLQGP